LEEYYFIREDNTGEENVQVNEIKNEDWKSEHSLDKNDRQFGFIYNINEENKNFLGDQIKINEFIWIINKTRQYD
jgi:hypothetical protein